MKKNSSQKNNCGSNSEKKSIQSILAIVSLFLGIALTISNIIIFGFSYKEKRENLIKSRPKMDISYYEVSNNDLLLLMINSGVKEYLEHPIWGSPILKNEVYKEYTGESDSIINETMPYLCSENDNNNNKINSYLGSSVMFLFIRNIGTRRAENIQIHMEKYLSTPDSRIMFFDPTDLERHVSQAKAEHKFTFPINSLEPYKGVLIPMFRKAKYVDCNGETNSTIVGPLLFPVKGTYHDYIETGNYDFDIRRMLDTPVHISVGVEGRG